VLYFCQFPMAGDTLDITCVEPIKQDFLTTGTRMVKASILPQGPVFTQEATMFGASPEQAIAHSFYGLLIAKARHKRLSPKLALAMIAGEHRESSPKIQPIQVITLKQPWASLIFGYHELLKDCENRYWQPPRGLKEVWIHAGKSWDQEGAYWISEEFGKPLYSGDFPKGQILGKVEIARVTRNSDSPWAIAGQYQWLLKNPQKLKEPIPARGNQKIWEFEVDGSHSQSSQSSQPTEKPYLPSNGADGYEFTGRYCDRCRHDLEAGPEGCEILALALIGEQPKEWRWISGTPTCTKFELPPPVSKKKPKVVPGQLSLDLELSS